MLFFVLEGFDFGVGMLAPLLGRDDHERGAAVRTIGPFWDGNEVWLVAAIGVTFAAFPDWYAALLSGLYLPMVLVLLALAVRGVALEFRGKDDEREAGGAARHCRSRPVSAVAALGFGAVIGVMVSGLAIGAAARSWPAPTGSPAASPRCSPPARSSAPWPASSARSRSAPPSSPCAPPARCASGPRTLAALLLIVRRSRPRPGRSQSLLAVAGNSRRRPRCSPSWRCCSSSPWSIVRTRPRGARLQRWPAPPRRSTVVTALTAQLPVVLPSTLDDAFSITMQSAAASDYALQVISVGALFILPGVLLYQAWSYWVFRKRVASERVAS